MITKRIQNKNTLRSSDCPLSKVYGLLKIHKKKILYRIIVSSIGTALYPLGIFLHDLISKNIPLPTNHIDNSFNLHKSLSNIKISHSYLSLLISLDVVSLFTNVHLELSYWLYKKKGRFISVKTSKNEFLIAVEFVLTSTFFIFNNSVYKYSHQWGVSLSPIIADSVMQGLKNIYTEQTQIRFTVFCKICRRYCIDCFYR